VPSGGTSDYAPEMIHAAARGERYAAFVRPDTRIPFMAMPDGVDALLQLASAPRAALTRTAYNVAAFNPSAEDVQRVVLDAFPTAEITWNVDTKRQGILDTWPADVDAGAARRDWGFAPRYGFGEAFTEYLIPTIRKRYAQAGTGDRPPATAD
jgi:nucleoside-diphosphate-sugar epimerase